MEKKQTGSLMTRNLGDLVKKEHFVLDSEYLTTLLVVVPLSNINDWHAKYESLTDMVVPRSTQMIFQDADNALMTVTLFHKVVEEYKHKVLLGLGSAINVPKKPRYDLFWSNNYRFFYHVVI